jgi:hypothetical protein
MPPVPDITGPSLQATATSPPAIGRARTAALSLREQDRHGHALKDKRLAADHHFAQAGVAIAAHDQQVGCLLAGDHAEPTQAAIHADIVVGTLGAALAKLTLPTNSRPAAAAALVPT